MVLQFDPGKHRYTIKKDDGKPIFTPSVTGIVGFMDDGKSGRLQGWAVKMGAEALRDELTLMMRTGVGIDEAQVERLVALTKAAYRKKTEGAAAVGTVVHAWIEEYIKSQITSGTAKAKTPAPPKNAQAQAGVEAFLAWAGDHDIEWLMSERKVYSLAHHYCGTLDWLAKIDGVLVLGDNKTSNYMNDEYYYQLRAYQQALEEEFEIEVQDRMVLKLGKEEPSFETHSAVANKRNATDDLEVFLALRRVYRGRKDA